MYEIIVTIHSIMRWLIILGFMVVLYRASVGLGKNKTYVSADRSSALFLTILFDVQLLLGLLLFLFLSPLTKSAFADMGNAMSNSLLRFFTVEHTLIMLIALVLVHVGASKSRKAATDKMKHKKALIYFAIAFILVLIAIPWPFLNYGRAWI